MKILRESLWDRLINRLPANDAQRIARVLKRAGCQEEIDYMAVKAMSELVEAYQAEARLALRSYRRWRVRQDIQQLAAVVRDREGEILRRDAREKAGLYLDARRDYDDLIALAMKRYERPANDDADLADSA